MIFLYFSLLAFDFAIFALTDLPILIHDSPLFKNIQNQTNAKLYELYSTLSKQSFIAVDEITKYGKDVEKLLIENKSIELSKDHYLFRKTWADRKDR